LRHKAYIKNFKQKVVDALPADTDLNIKTYYFTIFISFIFENGIIEKRALNEKDLIGWILG
jgi:uncharacterized membrane protein YiaA